MIINLLKPDYKNNENFYNDFIKGNLLDYGDKYIDYNNSIFLPDTFDFPDFNIYLGGTKNAEAIEKLYLEMINVLDNHFSEVGEDNLMSELFWHSYICIYKRDFILDTYSEIKKSYSDFKNIVIKTFNWENYIYKAVLAWQYINDEIEDSSEKIKYHRLINDNRDIFNYIIKYEIFRNSKFIINFFTIMIETKTEKIMKSKIKTDGSMGDDRCGRKVVYEFNKSYPAIMIPLLEKDEIKYYYLKFLNYYVPQSK